MTLKNPTSTPAVVQKKIILAPRREVFEAWTKPEILRQWFLPKLTWTSKTSIDLRVGGRYEHDMISDGSGPANDPHACAEHSGEYLEIVPPEKLVFTWNTAHVKNTRVTVLLRDLGNSTELTLTHELITDATQRDLHAQGWDICLTHLQEHYA